MNNKQLKRHLAREYATAAHGKVKSSLNLSKIALALLISSSPVMAETLNTDTNEQDDGGEQSWRVERIEVSGNAGPKYISEQASVSRTNIPLLLLPQTYQVLNADLIAEQQLNNLTQALSNIAGAVASDSSETVLANPLLRGFEAEIYVDGMLGYGDTAVIDPSSMIGVERIEVAKGPTSTLYGGGTGAPVGGLINVVTKSPKSEAFYNAGLTIGSFSQLTTQFDINQPLSESAGFRVAAQWSDSEHFIDEIDTTRVAIYPSFAMQFSEQTDLSIKSFYTKQEYLEYSGLPSVVTGDPNVDAYQYTGAPDMPHTEVENTSIHALLSHQFTNGWELQAQARYYANEFEEYSSFPFLSFFPVQNNQAFILSGFLPAQVDQQTFDVSIQKQWESRNFTQSLLLGAVVDNTDYEGGTAFNFNPLGILDYASGENNIAWQNPPGPLTEGNNQYNTQATYAQYHASIGSNWHILLSARLSHYELTENGAFNPSAPFSFDYTEIDPRVGITYAINDEVSVFAGYATGTRLSLFFNASGTDPKPESSQSTELGLKFNLSEQNLYGSVSYYQITRNNIPSSAFPEPGSIQSGEQQSQGFEVDMIWEPTNSLSVLFTYANTQASIEEDIISGAALFSAGNTLARVPENSARLAARYRVSEAIGFGIGASYQDEAPLTNANTAFSDSFTVLDLQADYQINDHYQLQLRIDNLLDREYFQAHQFLNQGVVRPAQPLSAQLSFLAKF